MKKKSYIKTIIFLFSAIVLIYLSYMYISLRVWENKILSTTYISNINVSGKSKEEAEAELRNYYHSILDKKMAVKYDKKEYVLDYSKLGLQYNIDEIVDEALQRGKSGSIWRRFKNIISSKEKRYELKIKYDKEAVMNFINVMENEINRPPQSAYIRVDEKGVIKITDEVWGIVLDREYLAEELDMLINNNKEGIYEVEAKVTALEPQLTSKQLRPIDTLISSFGTYYGNSSAGRAHNIALAVAKIDGTLIMPGETFSFNAVVGKRSIEFGYMEAPVIINNKLVEGLGGGVCQVSSTLYNSVIRSGLKSSQRINHSLIPAYIEPGFDATVSEAIDYKFKNTKSYPVYIQGCTKDGRVIFNIYSNREEAKIKYDLLSEIYEKVEPEMTYEEDPELTKGVTEKVHSSFPGCKVKVYLVAMKDDLEVSRELISNDIYTKVDGVMKIGTKEDEET
jgi:vancomycin resistance protein YoaR